MYRRLTFRLGELFVGAGGLSLGFLLSEHPQIRFQPVFGLDNDPESLQTYQNNLEWITRNAPQVLRYLPVLLEKDVRSLTSADLTLAEGGIELDILVGGSPCQGFSTSNRGAKSEQKQQQNSLAKSFLDQLAEIHPRMFLIENVQGVGWTTTTDEMKTNIQQSFFEDVKAKAKSVKDYLIEAAKELDYEVWHGLVNAMDYGIPQNRVRFILFGIKRNLLRGGEKVDLERHLSKYKQDTPTVRDAISDLPVVRNGSSWSGTDYHPANIEYVQQMRRFMLNGDLHDHFTTNHAEYVIERFKKIPQGSNWESIRGDMKNYTAVDKTHSNIYRRLVYDLPAHTISHYRKSMTIHPTQSRGLSMREACRLQSFPDWFRFYGKLDNQQQQLANAVPPMLARAIANAIADFWISSSTLGLPQKTCQAQWNFIRGK